MCDYEIFIVLQFWLSRVIKADIIIEKFNWHPEELSKGNLFQQFFCIFFCNTAFNILPFFITVYFSSVFG